MLVGGFKFKKSKTGYRYVSVTEKKINKYLKSCKIYN